MRTFAAPFEKRVLAREYAKFIEKTVLLYKKQVPRKNTIYREALISLEIISERTSWEIYDYYTMKSLILAQDER